MSPLVSISSLNDESILKLVESPGLSVVLFSSDWCGPCKSQKATIESLIGTNPLCKFGLVDCDANPDSTDKFFIRSIPTTVFFMDGKVVGEVVGSVPRNVIADEIMKHTADL